MMNIKSFLFCLTLSVLLFTLACSPSSGDYTGTEYIPDMAHSIAYEANVYNYYNLNTWGGEDEYYEFAKPRKAVDGTIARGYAGIRPGASRDHNAKVMDMHRGKDAPNSIAVPMGGSVQYHYGDTDEERIRATNEIINNPFPITTKGLAVGKELYNINCAICHGEKGDGEGWLISEQNPNAKYPAQPRNFIDAEWTAKSNGAYYHSIVYGKGVMGAYTDKLNYEERWQVIHYVRALQAKSAKLVYSEEANTLNDIDIPGITIPKPVMVSEEIHEEEGDHSDVQSHDNNTH